MQCEYCGIDGHISLSQVVEQKIDGVTYQVSVCEAKECIDKFHRDMNACIDLRTSLDIDAYYEINMEIREIEGSLIKR